MSVCCICGKEVSSSSWNTKDKFELLAHAYICIECGAKIGITNMWKASTYSAKKAKQKYLELYPDESNDVLRPENLDNEKIRNLMNSGRRGDAYKYVRDTAGAGQYEVEKLIRMAFAETSDGSDNNEDFVRKVQSIPNSDTTWSKKEVIYLKTILKEDEEVLHTVSGVMKQHDINVGLNPKQSQRNFSDALRTWLLVLTNKRILIINRHLLVGTELIELPLEHISSFAMQQRLLSGSISIMHSSGGFFVDNIYKENAAAFVSKANDLLEKTKNRNTDRIVEAINQASFSSSSPAEEIKKYKELLDIGAISSEEYETKKRQLLNI